MYTEERKSFNEAVRECLTKYTYSENQGPKKEMGNDGRAWLRQSIPESNCSVADKRRNELKE